MRPLFIVHFAYRKSWQKKLANPAAETIIHSQLLKKTSLSYVYLLLSVLPIGTSVHNTERHT